MMFWDTIAGHETAEVLCRCLPDIAEALKPRPQHAVCSETGITPADVMKIVNVGGRIVAMTEKIIVFEEPLP